MDKTKDNIKKYYSSKSMSEEKVSLLLGKDNKKNQTWGLGKIAIAAILVIGFVFTFSFFQSNDIEERIVKEIKMNHIKELKVEFPSDSVANLQANLDKLDFPLDKALSVVSDQYTLIGGRYCSIQGNLAAQLKIKNKQSKDVETLYITSLDPELQKVKSTDVTSDGINIILWKQNGLLYGKASNVN